VRLDGKLPGVSIHGSVGDDVLSVSSGRVIYAGPYTTFGRVVIVQSGGGYIYVYGGNRSLTVSVGDLVRPGTTIGELGEAPDGGKSRLYFSVWKNDRFVDPSRAPRS
jgi:lipoprotein NlpD